MAIPSSKLVLTLTLLLSIAALISNMPSAEALVGADNTIITGLATCPLRSSPITLPVRIVGAPVTLVCGVGPTARVLATTVTSIAGDILIALGPSQTLAFDPTICRLEVRVPPNICSIPLINNTLALALRIVNVAPVTINRVTRPIFIVVPSSLTM